MGQNVSEVGEPVDAVQPGIFADEKSNSLIVHNLLVSLGSKRFVEKAYRVPSDATFADGKNDSSIKWVNLRKGLPLVESHAYEALNVLLQWGSSDDRAPYFSCTDTTVAVTLPDGATYLYLASAGAMEYKIGQDVFRLKGSLPGQSPKRGKLEYMQVQVGKRHCAAIATSGEVYYWGNRKTNATDESVPELLQSAVGESYHQEVQVQQLSFSKDKYLALATTGKLYSWGGERSAEDTRSSDFKKLRLIRFSSPVPIIFIATGRRHSLALSADCAVYSWGIGNNGELGHGDVKVAAIPKEIKQVVFEEDLTPKELRDMSPICGLSAGKEHSALVSSSGMIFTFGKGDTGRLGHGDQGKALQNQFYPKLVKGLSYSGIFVSAAACGDEHTVVMTNRGSAFAWGLSSCCGTELKARSESFFRGDVGDGYCGTPLEISLLDKYGLKVEAIQASGKQTVALLRHRTHEEKERKWSSDTRRAQIAKEITPIPLISEIIKSDHDETNIKISLESKPDMSQCSWHSQYSRYPLSSDTAYPRIKNSNTGCSYCLEETIALLSKELNEKTKENAEFRELLKNQRDVSEKYDKILSRSEQSRNVLHSFLGTFKSGEASESSLTAFIDYIEGSMNALHARIIEQSAIIEKLKNQNSNVDHNIMNSPDIKDEEMSLDTSAAGIEHDSKHQI